MKRVRTHVSGFLALMALTVSFAVRGDTISISTNTAHYATTYSTPAPVVIGPTNAIFAYYGLPTNLVRAAIYSTGISSVDAMDKCPPVHVLFSFTGTNFEIQINPFTTTTNAAYSTPYFTISDGQTTTSYTNMPPFTQSGSANAWVPIVFSSNITHHVTLVLKGGFAGVDYTNGSFAGYVPAAKPNLLIHFGDSYVEGYNPCVALGYYGNAASFWFDGFVHQLEALQTNLVTIEEGVSGTGFYHTNGTTHDLPYLWRMTNDCWGIYSNALASGLYSRIFIGVNGTINDFGDPTNAVFQNATNWLAQTRLHCPAATVFMVGNWLGVGGESSPGPNDYALEWAMTNAAAVEGWPIFDPIPANLKNAGNYNVFYPPGSTSDSVHPSAAGYLIYATWLNTNLANTFGTNWTSPGGNNGGGGGSSTNATMFLWL